MHVFREREHSHFAETNDSVSRHSRAPCPLCVCFAKKIERMGECRADRQGASTETEYNDNDGENNGQLRRGREGGRAAATAKLIVSR